MLPLGFAALALPLGARLAPLLGGLAAAGTLLAAAATLLQVGRHGTLRYGLGGWDVPLGIALRADGLAAAMLLLVALVGAGAALHRLAATPDDRREGFLFWPLMLFLWGGLNATVLSADLFNIYVALEVTTLAAIALVAIGGQAAALAAALRYLFIAVLGSLAYLLGVALIYAEQGRLDLALALSPTPAAAAAAALMAVGLAAKTALWPLHFWLPPAHAAAPPQASALLSALVVKISFYLILRLWFETLAPVATAAGAAILGALGAVAVLWGSLLALRQQRLKPMVAYSTVAQVGYLFLLFPLVAGGAAGAWPAGVYHALSHGLAKAAMFLAAGTLATALGHDRIDGLAGSARRLPMTVFAFGLASLTMMGLPPSGGFIAKWLMLEAAFATGQWWWAILLVLGGALAAAYCLRALGRTLATAPKVAVPLPPAPRPAEAAPLLLALLSVLLGVLSAWPLALLEVGRPAAAGGGG